MKKSRQRNDYHIFITFKREKILHDQPLLFWFQYFQRNNNATKRLKNQIWSSVVTIVLIQGKNLLPMDDDGFSDPYVKFR